MSNDSSVLRRFRITERVEVTRIYEIEAGDQKIALEKMHEGQAMPVSQVGGDSSHVIIEELRK